MTFHSMKICLLYALT